MNDIKTISKIESLNELLINNCPNLDFKKWKNVPLTSIQLWGGELDEIRDTSIIKTLESLTICRHRKLKEFKGDNSNIKNMIVQLCHLLDIKTISTFDNLKDITFVGMKNVINISDFLSLNNLKHLTFSKCKVLIDNKEFSKSLNNLEKIFISNLKKGEAKELSRINNNVLIENNFYSFKNNELVEEFKLPDF